MARPRYEGGSYKAVYFPRWKYLGGETLTMNGSSQAATLPNGTCIFEVRAENGAGYFNIGGGIASATSPGYVDDGSGAVVGPLDSLAGLALFGAAGTVIHLMYFREE